MNPHTALDTDATDEEVDELFGVLYQDYGETLTPEEFSGCLDGLFTRIGDEPAFETVTVKDAGGTRALMLLRHDLIETLTLAVQGALNKKAESA